MLVLEKKASLYHLTEDELNDYVQLASEGDTHSLEMIVTFFEHIVQRIAYKLSGGYRNHEDLVQEGKIGLLFAIKNFDVTKSSNFKLYAIFWIRQAVSRGFEKMNNSIKIPVRKNQQLRKLKKSRQNPNETNDETTQDDSLMLYDYKYVSLETEYCVHRDNDRTYDRLESNDPLPEEVFEENEKKNLLFRMIEDLEPNEKDVICYRYGIEGKPKLTLKEIGEIFGLSSEAIRKKEIKIIDKLQTRAKQICYI